MQRLAYRAIDWFIPAHIRATESDLLMTRIFVLLHLLGPLMGHSVTIFLWLKLPHDTWQFWVTEVCVAAFFFVPLLMRFSGSMRLAATVSVQLLVGLSLFGSFYFGGISSPLLPWFLIAMVLGFFYLADAIGQVLLGIAGQLAIFVAMRILVGSFPSLIQASDLIVANVFSIGAALTYMTMLCLFYEKVMRVSLRLEQQTIDQRSNLEILRDAMQSAETSSKRKSIFLAKMSHELRTPLNAVIGYSEMLKENWEERGENDRKAKDLERIHTAGRHLLELVNNVIDLSSIETNRFELTAGPVLISKLVEEVVATASPLTAKRNNKLLVNMPEDLGIFEIDALKLRQSLLNLISNAAKFTTKGVIMLTVMRREEENGDYLSFEVTDNGIGIRTEALEKVFEHFGQAESNTKARYGGTGIGLTLTKRFCEMMGGSIWVRSEYGLGSSFTIKIPVSLAASSERDRAA
ncbi:MAG: HAMP domain-containing sensor histidine kinase [Croceibacterium sp.]